MKCFAGYLILAFWCAGVTSYWWLEIPLAATSSARIPPATQVRTLTPSGQLTLVHSRFTNGPGTPAIWCGPMEFWSFPDCAKARELFDQDDQVIYGPLARTREVLIRRDGRLFVVNSETGETIGDLPDVPGAARFTMVTGNRSVVVEDQSDLHLYEFGQEAPRWTAPSMWLATVADDVNAAGLLPAFIRPQGNGRQFSVSSRKTILRLDTGEPDTRFDHLGKLNRIRLAPNGRFAVVMAGGSMATRTPVKTVVCDASSGEVLWTFAGISNSVGPIFHADGDEVHGFEMIPDKGLQLARWRSSDGKPLPLEPRRGLTPLRPQSADGRFTLGYPGDRKVSILSRAINSVNALSAQYRLGFNLNTNRQGPSLQELDTGRLVGPLPNDAAHMFFPDRPALVSADATTVYYYQLPPRRDFWWLARWAILPPLAIAALVQGWRAFRRRLPQPLPVG